MPNGQQQQPPVPSPLGILELSARTNLDIGGPQGLPSAASILERSSPQFFRRLAGITPEEAQRIGIEAATADLAWWDKALVGYGMRISNIAKSLPLIGDDLAQLIGVEDTVDELAGLGIEGFVGSLVPDLLMFGALGGAKKLGGQAVARLGGRQLAQTIGGEAVLGATYGFLTHGGSLSERAKGAAFDAALFGTLGGGIQAGVRGAKALSRRAKVIRFGPDWVSRTQESLLESVPEASQPALIREAAANRPINAFEAALEPVEARVAARSSTLISRRIKPVTKAQKKELGRLQAELTELGIEDKAVYDVFEAYAGVRSVDDLLKSQASEIITEMASMQSVSKMLHSLGQVAEAADPVFITQMGTTILNDGLNVGVVDLWFQPFIETAKLIESRTGVPYFQVVSGVAKAKDLMIMGESELMKRLALGSGMLEPSTAETITSRQLKRIKRRTAKEVRKIDQQRHMHLMSYLTMPDLYNRATAAGRAKYAGEIRAAVNQRLRESPSTLTRKSMQSFDERVGLRIDNPHTANPSAETLKWLRENPTKVTGSYAEPLMLDPARVAKLPGLRGEHLDIPKDPGSRGSIKRLAGLMKEKGFLPGDAIAVEVHPNGNAFIFEGNHRVRAAVEAGVKEIPVQVRYLGGAEASYGPGFWHPLKAVTQVFEGTESQLVELGKLRGTELDVAFLNRADDMFLAGELFEGTDAKLWTIGRDFVAEGLGVEGRELMLDTVELRYAKSLETLMEDWRRLINGAKIPAGENMPEHLVLNGFVHLPPKSGYMAKLSDMTTVEANTRASEAIGIGKTSFLEARNNEMLRYETNPFQIAKLYHRRATKLITLEEPMRQAREFANRLAEVELQRNVPRTIKGMAASEAMNYWLDRVWGLPTKIDERIANTLTGFYKKLGIEMPAHAAMATATSARDLYYLGLIGLRVPFAAARNVTQAPILAGGELGRSGVWVGKGYGRAFKEMRAGDALGPLTRYGALPAYGEALDIAPAGAKGVVGWTADSLAKLRESTMLIFSGSDRLNRLASFWGGVEKFEYYLNRLPNAKLGKGQTYEDWLISKVGIGKLRPAEQNQFRRMVRKGFNAQTGAPLEAGERGIVRAREAFNDAKFTFGASVANRTQFAYSTVGSPLITRSIAGKLTMQFMTWPMYYGSWLRTMARSNEGTMSVVGHMAVTSFAAAQYLKWLDYDPTTSLAFGPFASPFVRSEYGNYTVSPGPAVASAVNIMGTMIDDASKVLEGDFDDLELPGTFVRAGKSAFPVTGADWRRLGRIRRGTQKARGGRDTRFRKP